MIRPSIMDQGPRRSTTSNLVNLCYASHFSGVDPSYQRRTLPSGQRESVQTTFPDPTKLHPAKPHAQDLKHVVRYGTQVHINPGHIRARGRRAWTAVRRAPSLNRDHSSCGGKSLCVLETRVLLMTAVGESIGSTSEHDVHARLRVEEILRSRNGNEKVPWEGHMAEDGVVAARRGDKLEIHEDTRGRRRMYVTTPPNVTAANRPTF
ncbi:hypothetical protein OH77DRAFT_113154 [Trametes cingulata]|nr:hypothetical protein OH77DRAFT_113154 [Trametes cingulata]